MVIDVLNVKEEAKSTVQRTVEMYTKHVGEDFISMCSAVILTKLPSKTF
ncbi:hypothetical protein [Anoxybacteroides tepidamans]|nr:hypothetical protein [Anoxybacillus tepidamans]